MKTEVAHFCKAFLAVVAMLVAGDFAVGTVADNIAGHLPVPYSHNLDAKECYLLHNMADEIILLGSSRCHHHYVASVLGDSIDAFFGEHHSIYNAGVAGQLASSNACAAEVILSRYRPELVIFDLSEDQMWKEEGYPMLPSPCYRNDTVVRRYIDSKISAKDKLLMRSSLYRYNGHLLPILSCRIRTGSADGGYLPVFGTHIDTTNLSAYPVEEYPFNDTIKANVERTMQLYKAAGVPFIVVCSPVFRPKGGSDRLKAMCEANGVPFIDLSDMPYFNAHPELFKDRTHLNDGGARVYTSVFFGYLKPYLSTL